MDLIFAIVVIGIILVIFAFHHKKWGKEHARAKQAEKAIYNQIKEIVKRHIHVLARKKNQLAYTDEYGFIRFDEKKWEKEVDYFVHNVLIPSMSTLNLKELSHRGKVGESITIDLPIGEIIEAEVKNYEASKSATSYEGFDDEMSGYDYEHFCCELLRSEGWNCQITAASGDQGADIIAEMNGHTVALQCKKTSGVPIGNKAVQEVYSAKAYYEVDNAVVVTNSTFSESARNLAHKLGIVLIHHEELPALAKYVLDTEN